MSQKKPKSDMQMSDMAKTILMLAHRHENLSKKSTKKSEEHNVKKKK